MASVFFFPSFFLGGSHLISQTSNLCPVSFIRDSGAHAAFCDCHNTQQLTVKMRSGRSVCFILEANCRKVRRKFCKIFQMNNT